MALPKISSPNAKGSSVRNLFFYLALMFLSSPLGAEVVPAFLFQDNAVLQRDKPIPVWGTAAPGERVSVAFAGKAATATADAAGKWRVDLPAMPANATPAQLVITGMNTVTLRNILVGEVWLASGQSNMLQMVNETYDAALDIPASVRYPMIRHIKVEHQTAYAPMTTAKGAWKVAGPETTGEFSAIAYYFARALQDNLAIPIGIIHSSQGASRIMTWMDPATCLAKSTDPDLKSILEERDKKLAEYPAVKAKLDADIAKWEAAKKAAEVAKQPFNDQRPGYGWAGTPGGPDDMFIASCHYNGMIHPLIPYALRGTIWYQGEGDAGLTVYYAKAFPALITGWRTLFAQGDFPFYWVQLSSCGDPAGTNSAFLRESQTKTLSLPNTGQALSFDLGQRGNIHPKRKAEVGRRLARIALARTYGQKIVDSGPEVEQIVREGAGFRVRFKSPNGSYSISAAVEPVTGFELAGEDQVFKPAIGVIGDRETSVLVTSAEVPEPVAVRYGWHDFTVPGLVHHDEGLPVAPFRSDIWTR
ncbi:MAG: sialate O-acetylesterase [Planctomycetes bacterium]|nr:sialate O-acetylesterase [Planctomycetota bacterium]